MFRKLNSKLLMIALIGLLAVVVGVYLNERSKGERSFKESLVQTDSAKIDQIQLLSKNDQERGIELTRNGGNWTVSQNGTSYQADNSAITGLLNSLIPLKTESVVSSNTNLYRNYDLVDSIATRVKLMQGSKVMADLLIGKTEMSSNQNISSYVKLTNDKVVYSVAGDLSMNVNRGLDSYRSRTVVDGNKMDWSKLEFVYPADSSFILEKQGEGKWHNGTVDLNPETVNKFLDPLQHLTSSNFSGVLTTSKPLYKVIISGNKLAAPIQLEGFADDAKNTVIRSSQNNGNLFDGKDLMDKIFPCKDQFLKK